MSLTSDDEQNWHFLRERSLQPGGFGGDRARIWPALLGAQPLSDPPPYSEEDASNESEHKMDWEMNDPAAGPHADERQIKLDTDRSFVLYPGEESGTALARDTLQNDLLDLLVSLFRKRRSLHYFQGFHDIITVLFLTLPRPLHLGCAEKMALYRVRDAMGIGLEPVLGLLRILRNLLRLVDPTYAQLLESTSPLPYHALSHLLTLFSHDVPTLPLIQHVWDFLLSREPLAVVWLAAALILHRKPSVYLLAEQDEEGMIHSLLGGLPELIDVDLEPCENGTLKMDRATEDEVVSGKTTANSIPSDGLQAKPNSAAVEVTLEPSNVHHLANICRESFTGNEERSPPCHTTSDDTQDSNYFQAGSFYTNAKLASAPGTTDQDPVGGSHSSILELAASIALPDSRPPSPTLSPQNPGSPAQPTIPLPQEAERAHSPVQSPSGHVPLHSRSSSHLICPSPPTPSSDVSHFDKLMPGKSRTKPPPVSLTHLLRQADDLLTKYPPSHPFLRVEEIMGPDSAMRTWRPLSLSTKNGIPEKRPYHESDDFWEGLVNSPRIVVPSPPPSPPLGPRPLGKKLRSSRGSHKALLDPRRLGLRLGSLTPAERRVLFMGALLVVGAAVALKSSRVPCVENIVKSTGSDGLKRIWNGKWTFMSSVIAAWGRGLP